MRRANVIFLTVMGLLLIAPAVEMISHLVKLAPLVELREPRSVKDPLRRAIRLDPTVATDLNGWFDDHYGFRELLVRLNNEISYQLFRTSDRVYIGKDGWLFDKASFDYLLKIDRSTDDAGIQRIVAGITNLKACLATKGVTLVVVFNGAKPSVYPEFLPDRLPRIPMPGVYEKVAQALENDKGLIFIDGKQIVEKYRFEHRQYYKTDLHMNERGSFNVYSEAVLRIAGLFGQAAPTGPIIQEWGVAYWHSGGEERFLGKIFHLGETLDFARARGTPQQDNAHGFWKQNIGNGAIPGYPDLPTFDFAFFNKDTDQKLLPPMVIFGTSFTDLFFGLGFQEYFKKVYRTKNNVIERIQPVIRELPPGIKLFLLEYPEFFGMAGGALGINPDCGASKS